MNPATTVSATAISGERSAILVDRSGRRISSMRMRPTHQQADPLARDAVGVMRCGQAPLRDHGDAVRNLEDLVEVLADDQHRRPCLRQVYQGLPDGDRGPGVDAPGRLADDQDAGFAIELPA